MNKLWAFYDRLDKWSIKKVFIWYLLCVAMPLIASIIIAPFVEGKIKLAVIIIGVGWHCFIGITKIIHNDRSFTANLNRQMEITIAQDNRWIDRVLTHTDQSV